MTGQSCENDVDIRQPFPWYLPAAFLILAALFSSQYAASSEVPDVITAFHLILWVVEQQGVWLAAFLCGLWLLRDQSTPVGEELNIQNLPPQTYNISLLLGMFAVFVFMGTYFMSFDVLTHLGIPEHGEPGYLDLLGKTTLAGKATIVLAVTIFIPICEELVFRVTLYRTCRHFLPHAAATIACALLFAVVHKDLHALPAYLALGLFLQEAYKRSSNLYIPIGIHCVFNSLMLTLFYR